MIERLQTTYQSLYDSVRRGFNALHLGERAAVGLEYAAVIVIGGLVIAVIYTAGVPGLVGERVEEAFQRMGLHACQPAGEASDGTCPSDGEGEGE